MAKDISAMAADLEKVIEQHTKDSLSGITTTVQTMAARVQALSSPQYGVSVQARAVDIPGGQELQAIIRSTDGPGRVFGGQAAVKAQMAKTVEQTAKEGGLDRRR